MYKVVLGKTDNLSYNVEITTKTFFGLFTKKELVREADGSVRNFVSRRSAQGYINAINLHKK